MKIALIMNHNNYVGRQYADEIMKAEIEFDLISIGHYPEQSNIEDERCDNLWKPKAFEEIIEKVQHFNFPSLNDPALIKFLKKKKYDLGIQGGTGILKKPVLDCFRLGLLNFHPGDLPAYRGCSAPEWQVAEGRPIISTCHIVDEGIDSGPIYKKKKLEVDHSDYHRLRASIYPETARFVVEILKEIEANKNFAQPPRKQDESQAVYRQYYGDENIIKLIKSWKTL